jgi:hypothetical protein
MFAVPSPIYQLLKQAAPIQREERMEDDNT